MTDLEREASRVAFRISTEMSKIMHVNTTGRSRGIIVGPQRLEEVEKFTNLSSVISWNGDAKADGGWTISGICLKIKCRMFTSMVVSTATYASETGKASTSINKKLDVFQPRCLRRILKIRYYDPITNKEVLQRSDMYKLPIYETRSEERSSKTFGHWTSRGMMLIPWPETGNAEENLSSDVLPSMGGSKSEKEMYSTRWAKKMIIFWELHITRYASVPDEKGSHYTERLLSQEVNHIQYPGVHWVWIQHIVSLKQSPNFTRKKKLSKRQNCILITSDGSNELRHPAAGLEYVTLPLAKNILKHTISGGKIFTFIWWICNVIKLAINHTLVELCRSGTSWDIKKS